MTALLLMLLTVAQAAPPKATCFSGGDVLVWRPKKVLAAEETRNAAMSMRRPKLSGIPEGGRFELTITRQERGPAQLESTKVEVVAQGTVRQTIQRSGSEPRRGPGGIWINVLTWDTSQVTPPYQVRITDATTHAVCVVEVAGGLKVR